jgi:hypothetical protein
MEPRVTAPITIALVNDYDIVVVGIAHILEQYGRLVRGALARSPARPPLASLT